MPIRWPFTLRRTILFKPVPGVDPRRAREWVCAPFCRFRSFAWVDPIRLTGKGPFSHASIMTRTLYDSSDGQSLTLDAAMQSAFPDNAERESKPFSDEAVRIWDNAIYHGTMRAMGIPQDGNRAARTGETE
jgi:hypothetical protein